MHQKLRRAKYFSGKEQENILTTVKRLHFYGSHLFLGNRKNTFIFSEKCSNKTVHCWRALSPSALSPRSKSITDNAEATDLLFHGFVYSIMICLRLPGARIVTDYLLMEATSPTTSRQARCIKPSIIRTKSPTPRSSKPWSPYSKTKQK